MLLRLCTMVSPAAILQWDAYWISCKATCGLVAGRTPRNVALKHPEMVFVRTSAERATLRRRQWAWTHWEATVPLSSSFFGKLDLCCRAVRVPTLT